MMGLCPPPRSRTPSPSGWSSQPAGTAVSQLTSAVEAAGGYVTALDVTASGVDKLRIDVTCAARDTDHADAIVEALRGVVGVDVHKVSDRTFLMHLGGTIEMALQASHPQP